MDEQGHDVRDEWHIRFQSFRFCLFQTGLWNLTVAEGAVPQMGERVWA